MKIAMLNNIHHGKSIKRDLYVLCIVPLIFCASCNNANKYSPAVNNGYIDLSDWDFNKDGVISLNGTWEFYWNKLYTPQDFATDTLDSKPYYLKVPGVWNSENLPGSGFGTYRLKIELNHEYNDLGIKILDFSSSYKLWINNNLVATSGKVSSVMSEIKPQMVPSL